MPYKKAKKFLGEHVEALTKISKAISSDLVLEDILKLIVTVTAESMNSNICSIQLLNNEGTHLEIRAAHSMCKEYNEKPPLEITKGICGKVVRENSPIAVYNILRDKIYLYKDIAKIAKLKSLLCVPLSIKGKVIGVINCYTTKLHKFTDVEKKILVSIANQAAISIDHAELFIQTKIFQQELEKRKIIERAKDILMEELQITGANAYKKMQKQSMKMRKSIKEIAEAVILAYDVKKDNK